MPGIGNDTDDKNYKINKVKDDKAFHIEFDLVTFELVLAIAFCAVKYNVYNFSRILALYRPSAQKRHGRRKGRWYELAATTIEGSI